MYGSYPDLADLTPVDTFRADDATMGAREMARRAADHALRAHYAVGRMAREVSDLRSDVSDVAGNVRSLLNERRGWQQWRTRAIQVALGIATIVGGAAIAHALHWGP
jgi:hypothetical protein